MTYKKFTKLVKEKFYVEKESYFHKGNVCYVVDFAYIKCDDPNFLYSVRFEIIYNRQQKTWTITANNHTATHPSVFNSRDSFKNIIDDINQKVIKEKHYWINYYKEGVNGLL